MLCHGIRLQSGTFFDRTLMVSPNLLAELRRRSTARVSKDPDFAILQQVIDEEKRVLNQKTISLNEAERRKEKDLQDARMAQVKKELVVRVPSFKETVYKFTLKQADLAGLPAAFDPKKEATVRLPMAPMSLLIL